MDQNTELTQDIQTTQGVPNEETNLQKESYRINFAIAERNKVAFDDISFFSKQTGLPVHMPTFDEYKELLPDVDEKMAKNAYEKLEERYKHFETGEYERNTGHLEVGGRLPNHMAFERRGIPTMPRPDWDKFATPNPGTHAYGIGHQFNPLNLNDIQQVAEISGLYLDINGQWQKNTVLNRMGKMLTLQQNPDPDSYANVYWKETDSGELTSPDAIRSFWGPRRVTTPTWEKVANIRGSVSGLLGMTASATGGLIGSLGTIADAVAHWDYNHYNENLWSNRLGNSFSNIGSMLTHMNQDEQVGMFNSWTGFSYGFYQGLGQLFSMGLTSRAMIAMNAGARMTTFASLGLGSAQLGGEMYKQIRLSGGNPMDAALAFYAYSAATYGANMIIGANLAQKIGLKQAYHLNKKNIQEVYKPYQSLNKKFADLAPETKKAAATAASNRSLSGLMRLRNKADDFLEDYAQRYIQTPFGKLRYGYMIGMGVEEFFEETVEEILHLPMNTIYNKYLAIPRAEEVIKGLSGYEYDVHVDDFGNRHYYKESIETGNRIPMEWNVWQEEQQSYEMAQNIVAGEFPLEQEFSWEEPFAALITSFVGGQPMFYLAGGARAQKYQEKKFYRQHMALDIAKKSKKNREKAINEIEERFRKEQELHNVFGSNHITADGRIVNTAEDGSISMAEHAINTFINDLRLDIDLIDNYKINHPETVIATRQNRYLQHEALETVGKINTLRQAITKAEQEKQSTLSAIDGLVEEGTTLENAQKQMEGLMEQYKYITEPADGAKGKEPSRFYKDLMLAEESLKYMFIERVKVQADKYFKDKKVDVNDALRESDRYKKKAESIYNEMLKDEGTILSLAWLLNAKNIKVGNEWLQAPVGRDGRITIPQYMRHVFKNVINSEMDAILKQMKQQETVSDQAFENIQTHIDDLKTKIGEFSPINLEKYKNWEAGFAQDFEDVTQMLNDISESLTEIGTAQRYNAVAGEQAQQLTSLFEQYANTLKQQSEAISQITEFDYESLESVEDAPDSRIVNPLKKIETLIKSQLENLSLKQSPEQRLPQTVQELSQEQQAQIREQAFMNVGDGKHSYNLSEGAEPSQVSFSDIIKDYTEQVNNAENEIANLDQIITNLEAIEQNMLSLIQVADFNKKFLQDHLSPESKKNSPLEDGQSNHLKLNNEQYNNIREYFEEQLIALRSLKNHEKLTKLSRELGWVKEQVRDLEIRQFLLNKLIAENYLDTDTDFIEAFDELNQFLNTNKEGVDMYQNLLKKYSGKYESSEIAAENKQQVTDAINKIYELTVKAEETLSGKLDSFILTQIKRIEGKLKNQKRHYNSLYDYQAEIKFERGKPEISGALTKKSMIGGKSMGEGFVHNHYILTWANMVNRMGQSYFEGDPAFTQTDIIEAYRDVVKSKFVDTVKDAQGNDTADFVDDYDNISTYEQEQAVIQLVSFLVNPDTELLHSNVPPEQLKKIMLSSVFVRGYAGTGKTEQVIPDAIRTYYKLTSKSGNQKSITVVAPTERLLKTHRLNEQKILSPKDINDGARVVYMTQADFINNKGKIDTELYIIDEASTYDNTDIIAVSNNLQNKTGMWLGDDAQTPSLASDQDGIFDPSRNMLLPIHKYAGERTTPITELWRSGNSDIFNLQDFFRKLFSGIDVNNFPILRHAYHPETDLIKGAKYYDSEGQLRHEFVNTYANYPVEYRTPDNIIYIVPLNKDIETALNKFGQEFGEDFKREISHLVFSAEYLKTSDKSVSGLGAQHTFFQFDANSFANQSWINDSDDLNIDVLNHSTSNAAIRTVIGRIGLTGVSRARSFVGIIDSENKGKNNKSVDYNSIPYSPLTVPSDSKIQRKLSILERLNMVSTKSGYLEKTGRTAEDETGTETTRTRTEVKNRHLVLTEGEKNTIAKTKKFTGLREQLETANETKALKDNYIHATELAVLIKPVKESIKKSSPEYQKYKKENRLKAQLYSLAARYSIAPTTKREKIKSRALQIIDDINTEYREVIYKDNPEQLEASRIKNPESYFDAVLNNVHTFIPRTELSIVNPTVINQDIKIKRDGKEETVNIQSHPAIIKIVGKTPDGKYIVDVEDFVFHRDGSSFTGDPGVYTKAKHGLYATLLTKAGYVVNRVKLYNFVTKGVTIQTLPDIIMTDNMLYEGIDMIYDEYFKGIDETEDVTQLATEDHLQENNRVINHPVFKEGFFYSNNKGDVIRIEQVVNTKNGIRINYFKGRDTGKLIVKSEDQLKSYIPIKQSDDYSYLKFWGRSKAYADIKNNKKVKALHVHGFLPTLSQSQKNIHINEFLKSKEQIFKNSLLGHVLNSQNKFELRRVYNAQFQNSEYNHKTKTFEKQTNPFKHVTTLEISRESLMENIKGVRNMLNEQGLFTEITDDNKLVDKLIEERFNILGLLNDPEHKFYTQDDKGVSISSDAVLSKLYDKYLNEANEEKALAIEEEIVKQMKEGFKEEDNTILNNLIEFNKHKLESVKKAKMQPEGILVNAINDYAIAGRVKELPNHETQPLRDLVNKLESQGFKLESITEGYIQQDKGAPKAFRWIAKFSRPGMQPVSIHAEGKTVDSKYVEALIDSIDPSNEGMKTILEKMDEISQAIELLKTDEDAPELLHDTSLAAKRMIEATDAYQFLRSNRAALGNFLDKLNNDIGSKMVQYGDKKNIEVLGHKAADKLSNLVSVLRSITNELKDPATTLQLRANPYAINFEQESSGQRDLVGKAEADIDNLVTTIEDIKTPELFISDDLILNDDFSIEHDADEGRFDLETDSNNDIVKMPSPDIISELGKGESPVESNNVADKDIIDAENDGEDNSLRKKHDRAFTPTENNSMNIQLAVNDIAAFIGEKNANDRVKLMEPKVKGLNDVAILGKVMDGVMYLTGYDFNGETVVEDKTPRHETAHFVMMHMLNNDQVAKVLDSVKEELGDAWDGTIRHLYEHVAESFETFSKPETLWGRFVQRIKEFANWLGVRYFNYKEMLAAIDRGYYIDHSVNTEPNHKYLGELYKTFSQGKYSSYDAREKAIAKFGSYKIYKHVMNTSVVPLLIANMPGGKSQTGTATNNIADAVYRTVQGFKNRVRSKSVNVGEIKYKLENNQEKEIKKFTPNDLTYILINANRNPEYTDAYKNYINFQLSQMSVLGPMLSELFPNKVIERLYKEGMIKKHLTDTKGASKSIHSDAENQNAYDRANDLLKLQLRSVPYYIVDDKGVGKRKNQDSTSMVPEGLINKTINDVVKNIVGKKNIDVYDITVKDLLEGLRDFYKESTAGEIRDAAYSLYREFGYSPRITDYRVDGKIVYRVREKMDDPLEPIKTIYTDEFGNAIGTGYAYLAAPPKEVNGIMTDNLAKLDEQRLNKNYVGQDSKAQSFHWRDKRRHFWNVLSAFRNHFVSMHINSTATANFETGRLEQKVHTDKAIVKNFLKGRIEDVVVNSTEDGMVREDFAKLLNIKGRVDVPGNIIYEGTGLVFLTKDGFAINDTWVLNQWENIPKHRLSKQGNFNVIYDRTDPKATMHGYNKVEHIERLLDAMGINTFALVKIKDALKFEEAKTLQGGRQITEKTEKTRKRGEDILVMLHRLLLASKVNHELSEAMHKFRDDNAEIIKRYQDEMNKLDSDNERGLSAEQIELHEQTLLETLFEGGEAIRFGKSAFFEGKILSYLSPESRILYDEITKTYKNEGIAMDTKIDMPEFGMEVKVPSPMDFYQYFDSFAESISNASGIDGPPSVMTPEGQRMYTRQPASALSKYYYGSDVITNIAKESIEKYDDETKKEIAKTHPIYNLGEKGDIWLNPVLSRLIGFDGVVDFKGVTNKYKGYNYNHMTAKDLSLSIIEEFFSRDIVTNRSFQRIGVIMSVLADKNKAPVMSTFFRGSTDKETISPLNVLRKGGRISNISINKDAFVKPFDLLIQSYAKRQAVAERELLDVIGNDPKLKQFIKTELKETDKKQIIYSELDKSIEITRETALDVRANLEQGTHYFLFEKQFANEDGSFKETKYFLSVGNTVRLQNIPFNKGFIDTWNNESLNDNTRYNLLRDLISDDFIEWIVSLKQNGALDAAIRSEHLSPQYLSTFKNINLETFIDAVDTTEEGGTATKEAQNVIGESSDQISIEIKERLDNLRNQWLADNNYDVNGNKIQDPGSEFKPLTVELLNKKESISLKEDMYDQMRNDEQLSYEIRQVRNEFKARTKKYTKKSINEFVKQAENVAWPPVLEAIYMTYWLTNESVSQLERGNPTMFKNPNDFVKRGAGLNAPGNSYDITNPYGIGPNTNVAVFNDIPGYNEFLNVRKGDKAGLELFSNGVSNVSPVHNILFKNSSGGDYGLHGDFANKTVVYGHEFDTQRNYYFKHSQRPVSKFEYENSSFYKGMVESMLGKHFPVWDFIYTNLNKNYDLTNELVALYATHPLEFISKVRRARELQMVSDELIELAENTLTPDVLPREEMIGYLQHASTYKQGLHAVNEYDYTVFDENGNQIDFMDAENIAFPSRERISTISVPNKHMRLQVVNNGDGTRDVHSFATQLFSMVGVQEWNHGNAARFNEALRWSANEFSKEINNVIERSNNEELNEEAQKKATENALLNFIKRKVLENAGRSIKGTKMHHLLQSKIAVGDVFGPKLFEGSSSFMNEHLKPRVPGDNYVQYPLAMNFAESANGQIYLASDINTTDNNIGGGYTRRMLKPLRYFTRDGKEFKNREEFNKAAESDPDNIVVAPQEVVMKFHYAPEFDLPYDISLQEVMTMITPKGEISLYETGLQRSMGQGATTFEDVVRIFKDNGIKTNRDLVESFKSEHIKTKWVRSLRNFARKNIQTKGSQFYDEFKSLESNDAKKQFIQHVADGYMDQDIITDIEYKNKESETIVSNLANEIAKYYFDLNNALDVITIRIPTTNASSASFGRIVAFSDTGNTVFTSAEKSILDGSDYDHDELHIFYPELKGTTRARNESANRTVKENNNMMFDSMQDFYLNPKNHKMVLSPIDLQSFRDKAADVKDSKPYANTPNHNLDAFESNMAGNNIVGHAANQMTFTTKLISAPLAELQKQVNPEMSMVLTPAEYENVIDFIGRIVNAAVDNPNEDGLLGNLGINEAVTPLIAGMTLHLLPHNKKGSVQDQILKELQNRTLKSAAKDVILSNSAKNLSSKKRLYHVLEERLSNAKTDRHAAKLQQYLDYVYAGEQLVRLGSFYKLTQEMSGNKAEYDRTIYNMKKAIGYMSLSDFIADVDRGVDFGDFSNDDQRIEQAKAQYNRILDLFGVKERESSVLEQREVSIRSKINIPRIVSKNPMLMAQVRALAAFENIAEAISTSNKMSHIRDAFLEITKQPELLFEDGHKDYENTIKKVMIGLYSDMYAPSKFNVRYFTDTTKNGDTTRQFDLKKSNDRMGFIAYFPDFVKGLQKTFAKRGVGTEFLNRIEFDKYGNNPILIANFRNSIYIENDQKAYYAKEFDNLVKKGNDLGLDIGEAFRWYQLFVYGFSFRNGSFSEVIDSNIELNYSSNYESILNKLEEEFKSNKDRLIREIGVLSDQALPSKYLGGEFAVQELKPELYKSVRDGKYQHSFLMKPITDDHGKQTNHIGDILIMPVYPKELYVYSPGKATTHEFTYPKMSKTDMLKFRETGNVNIKRLNHTGVMPNQLYKPDDARAPISRETGRPIDQTKRLRNRPYHGSYIVTPLGDVGKVIYKNDQNFRIKRDDQIKMSRVTTKNSAVSGHALDAITGLFRSAFRGINFQYVDNSNSLTDAIAYVHRGVVYLNRDKIQPDTHFHEIAHILLPIIKTSFPTLYNALKLDAQGMINRNDSVVRIVREAYPELDGSDFIDEIISHVVGFVNEQKVQDFLAFNKEDGYEIKSKSIWENIKDRVSSFWNFIGKAFKRRGNLNIDPESTTIRSFAQDLANKVFSGEVVLRANNDMRSIITAAYSDKIFEQRTKQLSTALEMYDAMMNTAKYMEGDNTNYIKQIRQLSKEERIESIKQRISNELNYEYKTFDGEVIKFDPSKRSTWDKIIEDKILQDLDVFSNDLKNNIVSVLSEPDPSIAKMVNKLGKNKYDQYKYNEQVIRKFFRAIAYKPGTKYFRYSKLPKEYSFLYSKELTGLDPIIAIEHEGDNHLMISLFNITREHLSKRDELANKDETNLFANYYTDNEARRLNIDLYGNVGNASNLLMGLIASKFNAYKKNVLIRDISTIQMSPRQGQTNVRKADTLQIQRIFSELQNADKFFNELSPELQTAIKNYQYMTNGFDYMGLLFHMYSNDPFYDKYVAQFEKGTLDASSLKNILSRRLRMIKVGESDFSTYGANLELEVIMRAMAALNSSVFISTEMNTLSDLPAFEKAMSSIDSNHLVLDTIRRLVIRGNQEVVNKQKNFKDKINDFAQYFYDRNGRFNRIVDKNWGNFKEILATVEDSNGIERYAGSVYWTKDSKLDPLFGKKAAELNISDELLQQGKFVVDAVTDIMVDYMMHDYQMKFGDRKFYHKGTEVEYTREIAKEDLLNNTTYKPGMIPLMHDTVNILMGKGDVYRALLKRKKQIESSFMDFEEIKNLKDDNIDVLDRIHEIFTGQFGRISSEKTIGRFGFADQRMHKMLGLIERDGKFIYDETNKGLHDINTDLENLLEFFHLSVNRKITYENNVLPVVNGAKLFLTDLETNRDFSQKNSLEFLEDFIRQAVHHRAKKSNIKPAGINVEPVMRTMSAVASPLVMMFNINVGAVSAVHNGMMAFIEGTTNTMMNAFTDEEKQHWFTAGDVSKASGLTLTSFHKVSQLLRDNMLMNPNDYELVMHRYHNYKRRKHFFSDYYAQIFNWGADYYARGVIMTAQMLRDGSWGAYNYDKESGRSPYDPSKDKRFEVYFSGDKSNPEYEKQKVLYEALKQRLIDDGIGLNENGEASQGYSMDEMRSFKTLADKYIVGAYGPIERSLIGQTMLGKMAGMFTTWFMTKLSNAYKKGSYVDELGYYKIVMDVHGNYIPQWQREWTEGYITTVLRMGYQLVWHGNTSQFKNLKPYEKKNLFRYSMTLATFLTAMFGYGLFVEEPERRERLAELRGTDPEAYKEYMNFWSRTRELLGLKSEGYITETRFVRNVKYAYGSLFTIPIIWQKLESPFAVTGIMTRSLTQGMGLFGGDWSNLKYVIPGYGGGYLTGKEQYEVTRDWVKGF